MHWLRNGTDTQYTYQNSNQYKAAAAAAADDDDDDDDDGVMRFNRFIRYNAPKQSHSHPTLICDGNGKRIQKSPKSRQPCSLTCCVYECVCV